MSQSPIDKPPTEKTCQDQISDEGCFGPPVMDLDHYRTRVNEFALSQEDQSEVLRAFWNILVTIADLDLGIDPVQMLFEGEYQHSPASATNMLDYSPNQTKDSFADAAVPKIEAATGREES